MHIIYFNPCPAEGNKADDVKVSHAPQLMKVASGCCP